MQGAIELTHGRARQVRAQARALRAEAADLCKRGDRLSELLVDTLLQRPGLVGQRGSTFSVRLPRVPSAVRLVRSELRPWLERQGASSEEAHDLTLACSEACANAVEHPARGVPRNFTVEARVEDGDAVVT